MFRVVFYFDVDGFTIRNTSGKIAKYEDADKYLDLLIESPLFEGGFIERYVEGIGWVINDEIREETFRDLV